MLIVNKKVENAIENYQISYLLFHSYSTIFKTTGIEEGHGS